MKAISSTMGKSPLVKLKKDTQIVFNMSNLPSIKKLRVLLLALCLVSVCLAPVVYMIIGNIKNQAKGCFIDAKIVSDYNVSLYNVIKKAEGPQALKKEISETMAKEKTQINHDYTVWGPDWMCQFTVFSEVSISLFSTIMGWMTLQIWPELMSVEKGHGMFLTFTFLFVLPGLCLSIAENHYLSTGMRFTCENLILRDHNIEIKIGCANVTYKLEHIVTDEDGRNWNLEEAILMVNMAGWTQTGILMYQLLVLMWVLWLVWKYHHYLPRQRIGTSPHLTPACKISKFLSRKATQCQVNTPPSLN